jgi:PAS domain S-box-containing protein
MNNDGPSQISSRFETDDRFRAIFDAVNDGIFISDPSTGQFIDINEPGCRMFGYKKSDLLGKGVNTLSSGIHPHTQDMAIELNRKARLGEPQIFEWQCKNKNGELSRFWKRGDS